jgi:hypothetical protein
LNSTNLSSNQDSSFPHPIPTPCHPKQYRAIGVVCGKYIPSVNAFTQGTIITLSGQRIDAVLLGKTISAVKNHVDLSQNNYWIVYPHSTFQEDNALHLQIVGVWQPNSPDENTKSILIQDYFSIRGEVIYSSRQEEKVIVKIYFNNSIADDKGSFFKLLLQGKIPDNTIKHFYNFDLILRGDQLVIKKFMDLGLIAVKYSNFSPKKKIFSDNPTRKI